MKVCPSCQKTYSDPTLNFCLECGTTLIASENPQDLPKTVFMPQSSPTTPTSGYGNQSPQFGAPNQSQGNWGNPQQPQFSNATPQAAPKGSKAWIWVLGILGLLVLACGGGFFALVALSTSSNRDYGSNNSKNLPNATVSPTPKDLNKFEMSRWKTGTDDYATTSYSDNIFSVEVNKAEHYYVLVTDTKTQNKTTKVSVKNTRGDSTDIGYGLVVHSYSTPLVGDYAFLIDSEQKRYRIVEHLLNSEKEIKDWKSSSAIKSGSSENILEVRDNGDKMEFYINGEFVTTVEDKNDNQSGVAGIYACDGLKIEYTNLTTESK